MWKIKFNKEVGSMKRCQDEIRLKTKTSGKNKKLLSVTSRLDWVKETRLGLVDKAEETDDSVKENVKPEKFQELSMKEIRDIMKSPNLWVMVYSKEMRLRSKAQKVFSAKP